MTGYTQIRYSWYIPLYHFYTHEHLLQENFKWVTKRDFTKEEIKTDKSIIRNFAKMYFDKTLIYPLISKDRKIRILNKIPFSPIYFASTKQKKVSVNLSKQNQQKEFGKNRIKSIKFSIKIYPIGLGVISVFLNFESIIEPKLYNHLVDKIKCGKKDSSINQYIQYLKIQLLKSLFDEENLKEIMTICKGPKIRINFIDESMSMQKFSFYADGILGSENADTNIIYKTNKKTNDLFAFHRKGIVLFTEKSQTKNRRNYLRNSLDLVLDIAFGSEILLPLVPSIITKADIENKHERINELIFTSFITLNPEILGAYNDLYSFFPTSGIRKWYQYLIETNKYYQIFLETVNQLLIRINELRVDKWYDIISSLLKENIPIVSEKMLELLKEKELTIREVLSPKMKFDEENKKIFDFLLEKLSKDFSSRYSYTEGILLDKDKLGYCTLNVIEKSLGITGRNHLEFKNRIDLLRQVGLLEAVAYKGPGSKKDSVQYRASPDHPYVNDYMKIFLAKESISEIKLK